MNHNSKRNVGEVFERNKGRSVQLIPAVSAPGRIDKAMNTPKNETQSQTQVLRQFDVRSRPKPIRREVSTVTQGRIRTLDRYRAPETFHVPPQMPIPIKSIAIIDPDSDLFLKVGLKAYERHMEQLVPCSVCGRRFFPDRIQRHETTCAADPVKRGTF